MVAIFTRVILPGLFLWALWTSLVTNRLLHKRIRQLEHDLELAGHKADIGRRAVELARDMRERTVVSEVDKRHIDVLDGQWQALIRPGARPPPTVN